MARILVVEDEPDLLDLSATFLAQAGHETLLAPTGREAIRLLESEPVDLVLLDLTLPDLDGWTVLDRIRANPATGGLPVLIVSGNAFPSEKARARYQGVVEFVGKPFQVEDVVAKVALVLKTKRFKSMFQPR